MTRLALDTDGVQAGVAQFQQALSAHEPSDRSKLASLASFLGSTLAARNIPPRRSSIWISRPGSPARKPSGSPTHLHNLRAIPPFRSGRRIPIASGRRPSTLRSAFRESFQRAVGWADEGLWSSAASAFELLGAGSGAGVIADRNRGLCCLWLADHDAAVAALRRYISRTKPTTDTVDLEALCQKIEPPSRHDIVDFDRLSWPIRNREGLLAALRADRTIAGNDSRPLDPHDPHDKDSRALESFLLLDRPAVEAKPGLSRLDLPIVASRGARR